MYRATLRCGTVLVFEDRSFLPRLGELVPCRHHGYCAVNVGDATKAAGGGGHFGPRARPRSQTELMRWLWQHQVTTVHALRRQRFTLRMVAAAERAGLLDVDLATGRVAARSVEHG